MSQLAAIAASLTCTVPAMGPAGRGLSRYDAAYRHGRRTMSVLQRRNGRGDRRQFWKPFAKESDASQNDHQAAGEASAGGGASQPGDDPNTFEARPPIELTDARLRKLSAALGPAYVRVGGTWANTVYFQDSDGPAPAKPPQGFKGILMRPEFACRPQHLCAVPPAPARWGDASGDQYHHHRQQVGPASAGGGAINAHVR
ncbi:hypothetical protein [Bradyrhizobium sp. STM 3557]|uniref:hypothetical protein n=1 Tax=Bradyrhizobium sp. STM 3557 TaxID=578920 RepID=UPI00388E727B